MNSPPNSCKNTRSGSRRRSSSIAEASRCGFSHDGLFQLEASYYVPVVVIDGDVEPLADIDVNVEGQGVDLEFRGGGCAVARFEPLGAPWIQRFAALVTICVPLALLALLRRRERRRASSRS